MARFVDWVKGFALVWGGPGLFVIGFLDSSFLSFPEVNDLLIVWMVTQHKERVVYYALMATAGSVLGCLALYFIARKGGETFLRRRFKADTVERGLKLFQKYGLLVVIIPALLPPPAPFKIFVLLAGVAAIPVWQFTMAIAGARIVRYGGEGALAVIYGDRATIFLRDHAKEVGLWLSAILVVAAALWVLTKRLLARRQA